MFFDTPLLTNRTREVMLLEMGLKSNDNRPNNNE